MIISKSLNFTSIFQLGNIEVNGNDMKKSYVVSLVTAVIFGFSIISVPQSYAIMASESGSSSSTDDPSSIAQSIGNAIERVASTLSQVVSPQPADSSAAQQSFQKVPQVVCRISITYVLSYVPLLSWTYHEGRLIPITTGTLASLPIENRICS